MKTKGAVTLFLSGDVMTGRGLDQALPHPSEPTLFEPSVRSSLEYVRLAEGAHGPIDAPPGFAWIWGDALEELERSRPDARIVNLETAVTTAADPWPGKVVHYRMHPGNVACVTAAGIDCCVLANNHVLDWGRAGLEETLAVLRDVGLSTAGAGTDLAQARAPAVLEVDGGRILVFAVASTSSGVPQEWAATDGSSGVDLLPDLSEDTAQALAARIRCARRPDDVVVVSIHWGSNWGYRVPEEQRRFAHALLDEGDVAVVHGHSSHHPRPVEVYRGRPILYGCGDFLNDYEGITGYEQFRDDLTLMYHVTVDARRRLLRLRMTPLRIRRFRLQRASTEERDWLRETLDRECRGLGSRVVQAPEGDLELTWEE